MMKEQIEELIRKLQYSAFRKGQRYEKQCREGLSGEMSEDHAPAMHHEMQSAVGELMNIISKLDGQS